MARKEVLLDLALHAFVFALGARLVRPTSPELEAVMVGQVQKAFVEAGWRCSRRPVPALPFSDYGAGLLAAQPPKYPKL